jgi:hypothetical protein
MKICYVEKKFADSSLVIIQQANAIITEYTKQGFELTLRQLYYQFVSRDIIANNMKEYKRLGSIINDARLAGLISWHSIIDRTRNLAGNQHWDSPSEIIRASARGFALDKWEGQPHRVEVWIEKDALAGVIEKVCRRHDVDYFSCRGYTSQSEMWSAAMRLKRYASDGQEPVIIHLGDHDPSGIDMTRDIMDRMSLFMGGVDVKRIALNMDQVRKYNPPPNPAKITDSRADGYIKKFGRESWELDALEPRVLEKLIETYILEYRDEDLWNQKLSEQEDQRQRLIKVADEFEEA